MTIQKDIAAKVLFNSDRTCVVCRNKGKPIQIHHIDEDNSNNDWNNLVVLCLDCHNETQIKGGFHRKLDSGQIILYRDDWYSIISRDRINAELKKSENLPSNKKIEHITALIENFRDNEEFEFLAYIYHDLGNHELRDKYIEKALKIEYSNATLIRLLSLKGKIDKIPKDIIEEEIKTYEKYQDWSQLARFYCEIEEPIKAIYYYCKDVMDSIDEGNPFSAAFYLKEMQNKNLKNNLFELALKEAIDENDIWWQYRALQELGWKSEIKDFVLENRKQIEDSENLDLMQELMKATGEEEEARNLLMKQVNSMKIVRKKVSK